MKLEPRSSGALNDVYAEHPSIELSKQRRQNARLVIESDADACVLARIGGTLQSLDIVPDSSLSKLTPGKQIHTTLELKNCPERKLDLLVRKILTMTSTVGVVADGFDSHICQDLLGTYGPSCINRNPV